jgi:hypothetical protein
MTAEKNVEESQGKKQAEVSCHVSNSDETKHTGGALQETDNESQKTTAAEDSSVMSGVHYSKLITSADVHSQSSTMIDQTDSDLDLIPATVVDTSNDASLVQMAKQANMVMDSEPDPHQMVKTSADGGSYDHVTNDGPVCDEKLQSTQVQESWTLRTSQDLVSCEKPDHKQHETKSNTTPDTHTSSGATQDSNHQSNSGATSSTSRSKHDIDRHMRALQIKPIPDTWKEVPTLTNWKSEVFNSYQLRNHVNSSLNKRWRKPFLDYDKAIVFKLQLKSH